MPSHKRKHFKKTAAKYLLAGVLSFGIMGATTTVVVAQSAPPTPPPPGEVLHKAGEGLKKINPFKKHKNTRTQKSGTIVGPPAGGPPPPPNPLNLFKKKKGGSALPPPPKPPGA